MKTLHLVCNSHLDPVWQWDWNEGASAALATFYSAVKLAEKYDYIFCHNEVLLYEYVEKYDPALFAKIQDLVACGKWKIMGGWYIQPDCLVPSGESFIRQSSLGRRYFAEKFNARPTTALNFDSFGHTRGLASILEQCGYDSYVFCRSMPDHHPLDEEDLPHGPFLWEGYDGRRIKALRYEDESIYCTKFGHAKEEILRKEAHYSDQDDVLVLWGVGNHGGVPSAKDLEDIADLQAEKQGQWKIVHTTLETYFASVHPNKVYDKQIVCHVKSYSSVNAIKLAHDQLENTLYLAEKMCSIAELDGGYQCDKSVFEKAEKILAQIEFHDVLSGTAIKIGTDSSIRKAHQAIEGLRGEMFGAFAAKASRLPPVVPRDDNIAVFNPYPYEFNGIVETEFFIEDALISDEKQYALRLYDGENNNVPFQVVKEDTYINYDRRKRILFEVSIPACGVASFGIHKTIVDKEEKAADNEQDIVVIDEYKKVVINRRTGLIDSFMVDGKEYIQGSAFLPVTFDDNEDPWGWYFNILGNVPTENKVSSTQEATLPQYTPFTADDSGSGIFYGLKGVTVTEDGPLLTQVQALFSHGESHIVVNYRIYKGQPYIDVQCHIIWNERKKGLKLKVPLSFASDYFAQMAFGVEKYASNGFEYPCNRYVGACDENGQALVVYNNSGVHSVSKIGKDLYLTLLNGAAYCAHPIDDRPLIPRPEIFVPPVEQGAHDFTFRVQVNKMDACERVSNELNQPVYALSFFPHGEGNPLDKTVVLSSADVVITALKKLINGDYLIRLYNGSAEQTSTILTVKNIQAEVHFRPYEFVTCIFDGKKIAKADFADKY